MSFKLLISLSLADFVNTEICFFVDGVFCLRVCNSTKRIQITYIAISNCCYTFLHTTLWFNQGHSSERKLTQWPLHCKHTMQPNCGLTDCTGNSPETVLMLWRFLQYCVNYIFSILQSYIFSCFSCHDCHKSPCIVMCSVFTPTHKALDFKQTSQ